MNISPTTKASFRPGNASVWWKSKRNLSQLNPSQLNILNRQIASLPQISQITRITASKKFLRRVQQEQINLAQATQTDLQACIKHRTFFKGDTLVLSNLQKTKRSPLKIMGMIVLDLLMLFLPRIAQKITQKRFSFGFAVHPRNFKDVINGFPFIKLIPDIRGLRGRILSKLPPFRLSEITVNGEKGCLVCIGWDRTMFEKSEKKHNPKADGNLNQAQKKISEMAVLLSRWGCQFLGLGALLPRYSNYGLSVREKSSQEMDPLTITTGHAYTVIVISEMVKKLKSTLKQSYAKRGLLKKEPLVAIVGAAGSTGACCAKKLVHDGAKNLLLIDARAETKVTRLKDLKTELSRSQDSNINASTNIEDIKDADIIVVVSSAPDIIITASHIKEGTFIVDDTQPANVCPMIAREKNGRVLLFKVLAPFKGINPNFRFDRHTPQTDFVFTCLADLVMRKMIDYRKDTIGPVTIEDVLEYEQAIKQKGAYIFSDEFFGLDRERISSERIEEIAGWNI